MFSSIANTLRPFVCAAVLFILFVPISARASQTVVPNRIVQPVDNHVRVPLSGYVSPLVNAASDRGPAPDSMPLQRMHLILRRSATQETALRQLIAGLNTPGSSSYHQWLTPEEFGRQFGPSSQDVATVESWLSSQGFSVQGLLPGRQVIEFSGDAAQMRQAFGVQIRRYQLRGAIHYATATNPRIPAALSPVVAGFASLNNFRPRSYAHVLGQATYDPKTHAVQPNWTYGSTSSLVVTPSDFAVQYDLPNSALNSGYSGTNYDGSGQTIAIINESNINVELVNQFRKLFGLPVNPPTVIIDGNDPGIDGINNPDGPNYASDETYIDVEWAGAVAPMAHIDLVIAADTSLESGLYLALEHAIYSNVAPIMSISFGLCESQLGSTNQYIDQLMEQAAAEGITVLVSSGDGGSAGCDDFTSAGYAVQGIAVSGFASTPWNVAVGGTDFYYSDYATGGASRANDWNTSPTTNPQVSLLHYIPEKPWNDSQYGLDSVDYYSLYGNTTIAGTGGGPSSAALCVSGTSTQNWDSSGKCSVGTPAGYPKPSWQTGTGVPSDGVRDVPDVSLFASDGSNYSFYPFCYADGDCQTGTSPIQISGAGGTSFAAPAFAGIMALVNQKYGRQGQADAVLYPLRAQFPAAFHEVAVGTNSVPCNIVTAGSGTTSVAPKDCIPVSSPLTGTTTLYGSATEGQLGIGTTPAYNAGAGYNLATGLGSVDAAVLLANWGNVTFRSTSATLTPSSTSFAHGTAVTISGSVTGTGTPTGNVALMTDSAEPGQQAAGFGRTLISAPSTFALDSSGNFTGSISDLPGGTYNIWGQYSGDAANAASTSPKTQITVTPENSSIQFAILNSSTSSSSTNTPAITNGDTQVSYGTQATLSAQVFPTTFYSNCISSSTPASSCATTAFTPPTGTMTFTDNGTTVNTAAVNIEGDAEFNAPFSIGTHTVTADYSGDDSYNKATSSAIAFTVVQNQPYILIGSSNPANSSSATYSAQGGQDTILNIWVENSANIATQNATRLAMITPVLPPTGTLQIVGLPGGTVSTQLAPAVDPQTLLVEGIATVTIPASTPAGIYSLTISYSGDTNYTALSGSGTVQITVPPSGLTSATTASMTGSISPTSTITVTGTVTGQSGHPAPTGYVYFFSLGAEPYQFALQPGSGDSSTFAFTLTSQNLFQGSNYVTLQYSGDSVYNPSAFNLTSSQPISNPKSDFSLTAASAIVKASATGSGTTTLYVTPTNGFNGDVSLSCAVIGAPTGVSCSLDKTSVTLSSSSSAGLTPFNRRLQQLLTGGGGVLACVLFLGLPARRRAWRNMFALLLFVCILGFTLGCGGTSGAANVGPISGGGGSGGGGGTPGTVTNPSTAVTLTVSTTGAAPGSYLIAVTGSSPTIIQTHTLGVTAAVQ